MFVDCNFISFDFKYLCVRVECFDADKMWFRVCQSSELGARVWDYCPRVETKLWLMDASLQSTIAIRHEDNGSCWAENMHHAANIFETWEVQRNSSNLLISGSIYKVVNQTNMVLSATRIAWDRLSFKLDSSSLGQTSIFQSFISRALTFMSVYKVL